MLSRHLLLTGIAMASTPAFADVRFLKCDVQVTFHRPTYQNTEWVHVENRYTKFLRIDTEAKMVSIYDDRKNVYKPICSANNTACMNEWNDQSVSTGAVNIDGMQAADDPLPPYLDFRRSLSLRDHFSQVHFTIADYGQSKSGAANMSWEYNGPCSVSDAPVPRGGEGAGAVRKNENPHYDMPTGPAMPVSDAERDRVLAGYDGNTMWGFSGGGSWLHMWFFGKGLAYTSDGYDISSETTTRQWYVGKDSTGYRMCSKPIPAAGLMGCYPLPARKLGDSWVQHDMDGDAQFTILAGRQ